MYVPSASSCQSLSVNGSSWRTPSAFRRFRRDRWFDDDAGNDYSAPSDIPDGTVGEDASAASLGKEAIIRTTQRFRANALNCRRIVGTGNPGPFAPTSWWSGGDSK
jgi:hypothetical protein